MVADACPINTRDLGFRRRARTALRLLVCAKAGKCVPGKRRIAFRYAPYQFEKERKRAWRFVVSAFMLRRTINR